MQKWNFIDELVRTGRTREAQSQLRARLVKRQSQPIARDHVEAWAALCRRAGWSEGGLLLLNPIVRPPARARVESSPAEQCEYAACLVQVGAGAEAAVLFANLSVTARFLYESFYRFSIWDYEGALPLLNRYLEAPELTPYQRFVGQVNRVAALVNTKRFEEAEPLLVDLRKEAGERGMKLLLGNLWEIEAQSEVLRNRFSKAQVCLDESYSLLHEHSNWEILYLLKWRLVMKIQRHGLNRTARVEMQDLIGRARRMRHAETWRDLEFHLARLSGHHKLAEKLYFGTPFPAFRERIAQDLNYVPETAKYAWQIGARPVFQLDVLHGLSAPRRSPLKLGQVRQRLLHALAVDFYKPQSLAALHTQVFPGRFYNPQTSPSVMHQALKRLRQWLEARRIPLRIVESRGAYHLDSPGIRMVVYANEPGIAGPHFASVNFIGKLFASRPFSRVELQKSARLSPRAVNYQLKALVENGHLAREGRGPSSRYRLSRQVAVNAL